MIAFGFALGSVPGNAIHAVRLGRHSVKEVAGKTNVCKSLTLHGSSEEQFKVDAEQVSITLGRGFRWWSSWVRRHLHLDNIVLDRVNNHIADRVKAELAHDVVAMCFRGLRA